MYPSNSSASSTCSTQPLALSRVAGAPYACSKLHIDFAGGCPPYSISATWYSDANPSHTTTVTLVTAYDENEYDWTVAAPVAYNVRLNLTDATGTTAVSSTPLKVISNSQGALKDIWCQGNVLAEMPDGNGTATATAAMPSSTPSEAAIGADDQSYNGHSDRQHGRGYGDDKALLAALAALLAVTLLGMVVFGFLYVSLRFRYKRLKRQSEAQNLLEQHNAELQIGMSEAEKCDIWEWEGAKEVQPHYSMMRVVKSPSGRTKSPPGPSTDAVSAFRIDMIPPQPAQLNIPAPTPQTTRFRPLEKLEKYFSISSALSQGPPPSSSTAAGSAFSTEFYHSTQARTVPLRQSPMANRDTRGTMSTANEQRSFTGVVRRGEGKEGDQEAGVGLESAGGDQDEIAYGTFGRGEWARKLLAK